MKKAVHLKHIIYFTLAVFAMFNHSQQVKAAENVSWGYEPLGYNYVMDKINDINNKEEVVIAILDSGLETGHPWFEGRIASGGASCVNAFYDYEDKDKRNAEKNKRECIPDSEDGDPYRYNFEENDNENNGHGTFIAGIIVKGTPSNVKILPIKKGNKMGNEYVAIEYVKKLKRDGMNIVALNFSYFGASMNDNAVFANHLATIFNDLYDAGIIPVISAGNDEVDIGVKGINKYPAILENVITVSSLKCVSSEYDICPAVSKAGHSNYGKEVDLAAPGEDVTSASTPERDSDSDGFRTSSGTSFAAPHVAAAIGLMYTVCPNCTPREIKNILIDTADKAPTSRTKDGKIVEYGKVLNLKNAYNKIIKTAIFKISLNSNLSGNQVFFASYGGTKKITFSNTSDYIIEKIYVDGVQVDVSHVIKYGYTFVNVKNNHTIYVQEKSQGNHKLNINYSGYKSYIPSQQKMAKHGSTMEISIPKMTGYIVKDIFINGNKLNKSLIDQVNKTNILKISLIKEDKLVNVVYGKNQITIDALVEGKGKITNSGIKNFNGGETVTYKFTPNSGYKVDKILIDGKYLTGTNLENAIKNGYTFKNLSDNHTIKVIFVKNVYKINVTIVGGGRVTSQTGSVIEANYGESRGFEWKANKGYKFSKLYVDGKQVKGLELLWYRLVGYTFNNIKANHTIKIVFVKK